MRERLEESAARIWYSVVGGAPAEVAGEAKRKIAPVDYIEATNSHIQEAAKGAFDKAKAEGKEILAATKDAVGKAVGLAEGAAAESAVQKALNQRYEKPEATVKKTVADVLRERYTPMDLRDNTNLRGL